MHRKAEHAVRVAGCCCDLLGTALWVQRFFLQICIPQVTAEHFLTSSFSRQRA